MTVSATTHLYPFSLLCLKTYVLGKTVIGPMLDVAQAPIPRHEVKNTFIKSHRLAFCVGMALRGIFLLAHDMDVLLNSPNPEEWNAWKHHYCARTWSTVYGWVKVLFKIQWKRIQKGKRHAQLQKGHTFCRMDLKDTKNRLCSQCFIIFKVDSKGGSEFHFQHRI